MTKFQKIQKIISIIPLISTLFISVVTIVELIRCKAPIKLWLLLAMFLLVCWLSPYYTNVLSTLENGYIIKLVVIAFISIRTSFSCVNLQITAYKTGDKTGDGSLS